MARKGPWGAEESWELSETQFALKDNGCNGSGGEGSIKNGSNNGSVREENGHNGSTFPRYRRWPKITKPLV